jgi:hypothetical protein
MVGSEDTMMIIAPGEQIGRSFGAAKLADIPPPTDHEVL